ncbi:hypothetical protein ACFL6Y_11485, partial [Elusimicrobiota bacterium]
FDNANGGGINGNQESFYNVRGSTFIYDSDPPATQIFLPLDNIKRSSLATISGTTEDKPTAGNVVNTTTTLVQVYIYRLPPSSATWNGSSWDNTSVNWITVDTVTVSAPGTDWELATGDPSGFTMPQWAHNTEYLIVARSKDTAQNQETSFAQGTDSNTITFDLWGATVTLTAPSGNYMNNDDEAIIAGTAADSPAGVKTFSIAISSDDQTPYATASWFDGTSSFDQTFDNAVFISSEDISGDWSWSGAGTEGDPGVWTWDNSILDSLTSDTTYMIQVRVEDFSIPTRVSTFTWAFTYDAVLPVSSITAPTHISYRNAAFDVTGTASDNLGISTIVVSIERIVSGNSCYDGTLNFDRVCPYFFGAGGTPTDWSVTGVPFADNNRYLIISSATDITGKTQVVDAGSIGIASNTFTYDTTPVVSTVSFPVVENVFSAFDWLGGVVADTDTNASGVDGADVEIAIFKAQTTDETKGYYWEASEGDWNTDSLNNLVWSTASYHAGASSWTFTDFDISKFLDDRYYKIFINAADKAGNKPSITDATIMTDGVKIMFDKDTPVSKATSPAVSDGLTAYLNDKPVFVSGTATDDPGSGTTYSGLRELSIRMSRIDSSQTREWYDWDSTWDTESTDNFFWTISAPLDAWYITLAPAHYLEGYQYEYQVQSSDYATSQDTTTTGYTNFETDYTTGTFVLDFTTPTIDYITMSTMSENYFNSFVVLAGSGTEPNAAGGFVNSGVADQEVSIQIFDISDTVGKSIPNNAAYWNGNVSPSTWTAVAADSAPANVTFYQSSYTWTASNIPNQQFWARWDPDPTGRRYRIRIKVRDKAGNETDFTEQEAIAIYDDTPPTTGVTNPAAPDDADVYVLDTITGTSVDPSTSGVSAVYVAIRTNPAPNACDEANADLGKYWDGNSWETDPASSPIWLTTSAYNFGSGDWEFDTGIVDWKYLCYYTIISSGVDNAGNYQTAVSTRSFRKQAQPAGTTISLPVSNNAVYNELGQLQGTFNDATEKIQLTIIKGAHDGEYYWNDGPANGDGVWDVALTSMSISTDTYPNWNYIEDTVIDLPGEWTNTVNLASTYTVMVVGYNDVPAAEPSPSSYRVIFDTMPPLATIGFPQSNAYEKNMDIIAGTIDDPKINNFGADIKEVRLYIEKTGGVDYDSDNDYNYWDNTISSWTNESGVVAWSKNIGVWWSSSWTYTVNKPTIAWVNGTIYTIKARARDDALSTGTPENEEDPGDEVTNVRYDVGEPTATVTFINNNAAYSGVGTASGTVADNFLPVSSVKLFIHNMTDNLYWTGSSWGGLGTVESTNTTVYTSSWSFDSSLLPPEFTVSTNTDSNAKYYVIWTSATDAAGNDQNSYTVAAGSSKTILFDKSAPDISINSISDNYFTSTLLTSITGTIVDVFHSTNAKVSDDTCVKMQISYLHNNTTYYYDWSSKKFSDSTKTEEDWAWEPDGGGFSFVADGPSSGTWTYNNDGFLQNGWISDRSYTVWLKGLDDAIPTRNESSSISITNVVIDTTPPSSVITVPGDAVMGSLASIAGTADGDLAGL